jgi:hypothetical protein
LVASIETPMTYLEGTLSYLELTALGRQEAM